MNNLLSILLPLLYLSSILLSVSSSTIQSDDHSHPDAAVEEPVCDSSHSTSDPQKIRVAVVGAGPSGLFFCHALQKLMNGHGDDGRDTFGQKRIEVTAFEKSSHPGGLWQNANKKNQVKIYDNMWTNGPSFTHEFYDYTYEEHFDHQPVDVYFPRQKVLDYILARVQRNSTDFFQKFIKFDTEVLHVEFNDADQVFKVTTKDLKTGTVTSGYYEKCVWAAGGEGTPNMPMDVVADLREFGFQGQVIHSSDMSHFEENVRGQRILLIGGGLSAEDLALQAIKRGVEKVFIAARSRIGPGVSMTTAWPDDKVQVLLGWQLGSIPTDGEYIFLESVKYDEYDYVRDERHEDLYLNDIDTIIFCTGYNADMSMLEKNLQKGTSIDLEVEDIESPTMPKDWSMEENCMTWRLGEVEPSWYLQYESGYYNPMVHRGVLISNPNMMFLSHLNAETPLLSIDVLAHLFAGYIYGTIDVPTTAEMQQANLERFHHMMQNPYSRVFADEAYAEAFEEWMEDVDLTDRQDAADEAVTVSAYCFDLQHFHQLMVDANYPLRLVGPEGLTCPSNYPDFDDENIDDHPLPHGLTELGELFLSMDMLSANHRTLNEDPANSRTLSTFRDYTDGSKFRSLYTQKEARPSLDDKWINL